MIFEGFNIDLKEISCCVVGCVCCDVSEIVDNCGEMGGRV